MRELHLGTTTTRYCAVLNHTLTQALTHTLSSYLVHTSSVAPHLPHPLCINIAQLNSVFSPDNSLTLSKTLSLFFTHMTFFSTSQRTLNITTTGNIIILLNIQYLLINNYWCGDRLIIKL
jgi:hypothetical protein